MFRVATHVATRPLLVGSQPSPHQRHNVLVVFDGQLMVPVAAIGDLIELLHSVPIPAGVE